MMQARRPTRRKVDPAPPRLEALVARLEIEHPGDAAARAVELALLVGRHGHEPGVAVLGQKSETARLADGMMFEELLHVDAGVEQLETLSGRCRSVNGNCHWSFAIHFCSL